MSIQYFTCGRETARCSAMRRMDHFMRQCWMMAHRVARLHWRLNDPFPNQYRFMAALRPALAGLNLAIDRIQLG